MRMKSPYRGVSAFQSSRSQVATPYGDSRTYRHTGGVLDPIYGRWRVNALPGETADTPARSNSRVFVSWNLGSDQKSSVIHVGAWSL